MKKITFLAAVNPSLFPTPTIPWEGYLFFHPNHPGIEFVVCRAIGRNGVPAKDLWGVCEREHGNRVGGAHLRGKTRQQAIDRTSAYLSTQTPEFRTQKREAWLLSRAERILKGD